MSGGAARLLEDLLPREPSPRRLGWRLAEVVDKRTETPAARQPVYRLVLAVADWTGHLAGQHVDVRLTAEDGYSAQRSYSIASPPRAKRLELLVERIVDGEVSPWLTDVARPGDTFELRGPIGGYFVWEPRRGGPLQLIAGGSGIAPLLSMIAARNDAPAPAPARLLYSARSAEDVIAAGELDRAANSGVDVTVTLTRSAPAGWTGATGRIDAALLARATWPSAQRPLIYVCGPTGFVEAAANLLVAAGHAPNRVLTERFGATGDVR